MRGGRDVEHNIRKINNLNNNLTARVAVLPAKGEENVVKEVTSSACNYLL